MEYKIVNIVSPRNVPKWGNTAKYIAVHYLGVDGQNNDIAPDGTGAHYYIYWDGTIYWRCAHNAIVYQVGTANGEFIQKHPYARNANCIGIEMCPHCDGNSKLASDPKWYFTQATQEACVWLVQKLMKELGIPSENVLRHFDIVNKVCPAPYVHNNKYKGTWTWEEFKSFVINGSLTLYRVRYAWNDEASQVGAFYNLDNAKACADAHPGFSVYDEAGKCLYTSKAPEPGKYPKGKPASKEAYIVACGSIARELMKETGILASVVTAQCCLETGFGLDPDSTPLMAADVNNLLGMKVDLINSTWHQYSVWHGDKIKKKTPEYKNGKMVMVDDWFRKYTDYENCIHDYESFLSWVKNDKGYKYRRIIGMTDPVAVIHAIRIGTGTSEHPEGYCTDPAYEGKILDLIKQYNLRQYDVDAPAPQPTPTPTPTPTPGKKYRVCVGIYQKAYYINRLRTRIKNKLDLDCFTEDHPDGTHIYCGSFEDPANAKAREKLLNDAGFKDSAIEVV